MKGNACGTAKVERRVAVQSKTSVLCKLGGPPPCTSGIIGIQWDPNIILIVPYSHYYRVGGPPNM